MRPIITGIRDGREKYDLLFYEKENNISLPLRESLSLYRRNNSKGET